MCSKIQKCTNALTSPAFLAVASRTAVAPFANAAELLPDPTARWVDFKFQSKLTHTLGAENWVSTSFDEQTRRTWHFWLFVLTYSAFLLINYPLLWLDNQTDEEEVELIQSPIYRPCSHQESASHNNHRKTRLEQGPVALCPTRTRARQTFFHFSHFLTIIFCQGTVTCSLTTIDQKNIK